MRQIELSPKQCEFINKATHKYNGKIGATQCGKTFIDVSFIIPDRIRKRRGKQGLTLILGVTKETIERNVLEPMRDFWGADLVGAINSRNIAVLFGEKVYCLGAEKVSQASKLRGAKFKYVYCDELVECNKEVFELLKSRLSLPYSICDFTGNPSYPTHYVKEFIDGNSDVYCQSWTIDDNPFLDAKVVSSMKQDYAGTIYYDRYILGLWKRAEGAIYRLFADDETKFYVDYDKINKYFRINNALVYLEHVIVGVDFGGNNSAHAFVATGISQGYREVIILRSERHNATGTTPEDIVILFLRFISKVQETYGDIDMVFADSAEQILINLLRQRTDIPVYNSIKGEIVNRIRFTVQMMAKGRLFITRDCENVADFFRTAVYDSKSIKDKRLDDGSYDQDSGDAWEYSIEYYMSLIIRENGLIE